LRNLYKVRARGKEDEQSERRSAAPNFLFMIVLLESDTETSRPGTRTWVVEVIDARGAIPGNWEWTSGRSLCKVSEMQVVAR